MKTTTTTPAFRFMILCALTLQTSSYVLFRRLSAKQHSTFDKSAVLLVAEVWKLVVSVGAILSGLGKGDIEHELLSTRENMDSVDEINEPFERRMSDTPLQHLWFLLTTSGPMAIQAVVYLLQNIIAFMALECIDGGMYSLLMQGKIFATAAFSMAIMGRLISPGKWRALLMLVLAVIQISYDTKPTNTSAKSTNLYIKGLVFTFLNVMMSGFSTVFMEKTFKDTSKDLTIWERNFQLSVCSIVVYFGIVVFDSGLDIFHGWNWMAFTISILGALGGIIVAFSLKFTDSILKSFASTMAIVLTTLIEWQFMEGAMSVYVAIGGMFVILSVYAYNDCQ